MVDLLGVDFSLVVAYELYVCHDCLLVYEEELFIYLVVCWRDLFNVSFDVLLYDLTSTYFEIDVAAKLEGDKRATDTAATSGRTAHSC